MEIFYSENIENNHCTLEKDEAVHCIKVLRHKVGDTINIIDGKGAIYQCIISELLRDKVLVEIKNIRQDWGAHPYRLTLAVCPTKNTDRYEWFVEKATEIGVDEIVPIIGTHSERKILKTERLNKIILSATKQSLKGSIPHIQEPLSVKDFILQTSKCDALKLIAYCFDGDTERKSIKEILYDFKGSSIIIMIGPEGDFSLEEVQEALKNGYQPVHLGNSRLRTETAAVTAASSVYFNYM